MISAHRTRPDPAGGRSLGLAALAFALALAIAVPAPARAADPTASPEGVVAAQLEALQFNDDPVPDAGIARTFELAHPDNRRFTGPIERFAAMVRSEAYRALIGHRRHAIEPVAADESGANEGEESFRVTIEAADGQVVDYIWVVARDAAGKWLTIRVSPPRPAGYTA